MYCQEKQFCSLNRRSLNTRVFVDSAIFKSQIHLFTYYNHKSLHLNIYLQILYHTYYMYVCLKNHMLVVLKYNIFTHTHIYNLL